MCPNCLDAMKPAGPISVRGARSAAGVVAYEGTARALVLAAKGQSGRGLLRWWADAIAADSPDDIDLVSWVPASRSGRRWRGHDQGRVLASAVARRLGRRSLQTLRRPTDDTQRGAHRLQRSEIEMKPVRALGGESVLLIADVYTTGASCGVASRMLLQAGARRVDVRVMAVVARSGADPTTEGVQ